MRSRSGPQVRVRGRGPRSRCSRSRFVRSDLPTPSGTPHILRAGAPRHRFVGSPRAGPAASRGEVRLALRGGLGTPRPAIGPAPVGAAAQGPVLGLLRGRGLAERPGEQDWRASSAQPVRSHLRRYAGERRGHRQADGATLHVSSEFRGRSGALPVPRRTRAADRPLLDGTTLSRGPRGLARAFRAEALVLHVRHARAVQDDRSPSPSAPSRRSAEAIATLLRVPGKGECARADGWPAGARISVLRGRGCGRGAGRRGADQSLVREAVRLGGRDCPPSVRHDGSRCADRCARSRSRSRGGDSPQERRRIAPAPRPRLPLGGGAAGGRTPGEPADGAQAGATAKPRGVNLKE